MQRKSGADAVSRDVRPCFTRHHAGFGWGMRRETFNELGGFFDASVAGNSDSFFMLSLRDNDGHKMHERYFETIQDSTIRCSSYTRYKNKATAQRLSVGAPEDVDVLHLWHGSRKHRQYVTRVKHFPRKDDGEFAVHTGENGLQVWDNIREANGSVAQYFTNKRDDG